VSSPRATALAGRGPGGSDSGSATGAAAGSGGRQDFTAGITPRRSPTVCSPNIGICTGGTPNRTWIRGDVNAYSHWGGNGVVPRSFEQPGRVSPQGRARPDLYVGRNGQVYQHRSDGRHQQNKSGQWQRTPSNPGLERQRQSCSLGQSRQGEFENRGQGPGIPRTMAPSRGGGRR
jgi:hypothetical protein